MIFRKCGPSNRKLARKSLVVQKNEGNNNKNNIDLSHANNTKLQYLFNFTKHHQYLNFLNYFYVRSINSLEG